MLILHAPEAKVKKIAKLLGCEFDHLNLRNNTDLNSFIDFASKDLLFRPCFELWETIIEEDKINCPLYKIRFLEEKAKILVND